jgi:hypothetical protein
VTAALPRDLARRAQLAQSMLRPRIAARSTSAWLADRRRRSAYRHLTEAELRATCTSDTVFVLGSGKSVLDVGEATWRAIERYQTVSFSQFARQQFVRADYHVHGEIYKLEEYARWFHENPHYASTVHVVQEGWPAFASNELIGRGLLPPSASVFRYRRTGRARLAPPSRSFRGGLVHGWNSATSVTNFALLMGWKRIVLVGVDLYDRAYFWLPDGTRREDEEEFLAVDDRFLHAQRIASMFALWREAAEREGVAIEIYNPRSILADVLDVFDPAEL